MRQLSDRAIAYILLGIQVVRLGPTDCLYSYLIKQELSQKFRIVTATLYMYIRNLVFVPIR